MNKIVTRIALIALLSVTIGGCIQSPGKHPPLITQAEQYQRRGMNAFKQGDYLTAKSMFEYANRLYESIDDTDGTVRININLAETAIRTHDLTAAKIHLQQARDIAAGNHLAGYQSRVTLLESTLALLMGEPGQAQDLIEPLLPQFHDEEVSGNLDDITLSAIANRTRIAFERNSGHSEIWVRRFANALRAARNNDPVLTGRLLRFQAQLAEQGKDYDRAHELLDDALVNYKAALSQPGISATLLQSGRLYAKQGHWLQARKDLQRGTAIRIRMLDSRGAMQGLETLVGVETELGNRELANSLKQWITLIRQDSPVDWQAVHRGIRSQ